MKRSAALILVLILPLLAACSEPTGPADDTAALFAKGGNGGNGGDKGGPGGGTSGDITAAWSIPTASEVALRSDGAGDYANGNCAVSTRIFAGASGDATIQTDKPKGKGCGRTFTVAYPDGTSEVLRAFANLRDMASIPVGTSADRAFVFNPGVLANNPSRCGRLIFGAIAGSPGSAGSDMVSVSRTGARTWVINSSIDQRAYCENEDAIFEGMHVKFTITASADVP